MTSVPTSSSRSLYTFLWQLCSYLTCTPPVLATRGLPSQKDRNALTNAALATLHNILRLLPGQYAVLPVSHYQLVSVRSSRHRRSVIYYFVHPEQDERSREKAGQKWVNDQLWEVIFIGTPQDRMDGTVHERADEAKKAIFTELAKVRRGQHVLDPPFLAYFGGFMFEYMHSAADFQGSPRGAPGYSFPAAICIFNIPPNLLALDACNILASDPRNAEVLRLLRNGITVPPVPASRVHNCWRLYLLGDFDHLAPLTQHFHLEPLDQYLLHNHGLDTSMTMEHCPIQGLQMYTQLRQMYENYYCAKDVHDPTPVLATDDSQGSTRVQHTTPHTAVPANSSRGEAWQTPAPQTDIIVPSAQDFPPLSATTALTRASETRHTTEDGTLVSFKANIENYIHSILEKSLEGVRKEHEAAMDKHQQKTDAVLASMEQKLTQQQQLQIASDLQSRVDPINRTFESLRARQLSLYNMKRDLRKIGPLLTQQQQEEHDELSLQIKTEQDEITKAGITASSYALVRPVLGEQ